MASGVLCSNRTGTATRSGCTGINSGVNLSKKPLQIDLVIIKKMDWKRTLQNEIGHIMRGHNILEYKGPVYF